MTEELSELYRHVCAVLDTDARAWVIGVGQLVDCADRRPVTADVVVQRALTAGLFPAGPFGIAPELVEFSYAESGALDTAALGAAGAPSFEARVVVEARGIAVALTRSGRLDDGSVEPTHVMLSDVEAVLVDIVELVLAYAGETGHAGTARVRVGIECAVPGRALELRVYDEWCGDNLRPAAGYSRFDPVEVIFPGRLDEDAAEQLRWDTAVRLAHTFGVFVPQLVGQAKTVTTVSYRPSPQAS